jgi:hypothetical protein
MRRDVLTPPRFGTVSSLAAGRMLFAVARLQSLLAKANFNQPRVPKGQSGGGQWTRDGEPYDSVPLPNLELDDNGNPRLPATRPDSIQGRNRLSKQLARVVRKLPPLRIIDILRESDWLLDNAFAILTYQDPPRTLEELQQRAATAKALRQTPLGYHVHHIVEQEAARRAGFSKELIKGRDNEVLVPKYSHEDITGWYMRRNKEFGGLPP